MTRHGIGSMAIVNNVEKMCQPDRPDRSIYPQVWRGGHMSRARVPR